VWGGRSLGQPGLAPAMAGSERRTNLLPYRPDIDGLRAVAVLAVVLFHAYRKQATGGFVGVDSFFVISGFLISGIIWDALERDRFRFSGFYGRRIRRLFPALLIVLAACIGYGWIVLLPVELAELGKSTLWGAGFLSNILLWQQAGYFDRDSVTKPLLHLWSLGVEEQFYILWPFALWAVHKTRLNRAGFLLAVLVASFILAIWLTGRDSTAAFYSPLTRFWEFASGALIASSATRPLSGLNAVMTRIRQWQPAIDSWISVIGFALLAGSAALLNERMPFPGIWAVPPVLGSVLIIAAGQRAWLNRVVLSHRVPVYIGLISYPLYLWHWPLISYFDILHFGKAPRELQALGLVAASFVLASATYAFVERPIRFGGAMQAKTVGLVVLMLIVAGGGGGLWQANGVEARFSNLPNIAIGKIDEAVNDTVFKPTKDMAFRQEGIVRIGEIGQGPDAVLFSGDSLLFQFGPRVQQLFTEGRLHKTVMFVVGPSCPPIPGIIRGGAYAACSEMPRVISEHIATRHVTSIVLGANWAIYPGAGNEVVRDGKQLQTGTPAGIDAVYANLEDEVAGWVATGHKVYLILPTPADERFAPQSMISRSLTGIWINPNVGAGVPVALLNSRNAAVVTRLSGIAERTGATLLDPIPAVCGTGPTCPIVSEDGSPRFVDLMHMRGIFVANHLTFLDAVLTQ
jgi:peptidoglycan/LPS O-acetylase OafA/YrhL